MKAYIQSYPNGIPKNDNFMSAYDGFREMGFEIVTFHDLDVLRQSAPEDECAFDII